MCPPTIPRCYHVSSCTLGSPVARFTGAVQLLSAGPRGPHGGTLLSSFIVDCRGPPDSPAQLLRWKPTPAGPRYRSGARLTKEASVTQVPAVQVLSRDQAGQDRAMVPDLSRLALNLSFSTLDFHLFHQLKDPESRDAVAALSFPAGNCFHLVFSLQQEPF